MTDQADFTHSVASMIAHIRQTEHALYEPSRFWSLFNGVNATQLRDIGLESFKRSVNQNYFNWIPLSERDNQFRSVARHWAEDPSVDALGVTLDGDVGIAKAFAGNPLADPHIRELYWVFVGLLWHHARAICGHRLTEQLAEPPLGNPLRCSLGGRLISQDLANSIRECTVCLAPLEAELMSARPLSVVEIGAGYGRLGFVLLTGTPCRYTVVDIPPALALAQWYLTTLFPQVPTFRFRPWHSFADVQSEMESADVRFLTPDQFALCPVGYFDLGITISTLPEMTRAQCAFYLSHLARTASRVVYIRQWRTYHNAQDDITVRREDYALPDPWRLGIDRVDSVHDGFFERLWQRAG